MTKKYSVALGGWAARGISHIGVLQYMKEQNMEIEEMSGTSIWAIIAGLYGIGKTPKQMWKLVSEINYLKLVDINMKQGVFKWDKVYKKLHSIFWDVLVEDLSIPIKIVATSLEDGEKKVFTTWKLIEAIRASISLPWVFQPHIIWGKPYIDGYAVNNLPIEVLDWKDIIAVTTLKKWNEELKMKRKVLWIDFNVGFISHNFQILQRTVLIMMKQNEERSIQTKDKNIILIKPEYWDLEFYSFNKVDELVTVGYKAAKEKLIDTN